MALKSYYYITVALVVLSMSCKKPVHPHYEITKIELARSGAWSDPGTVIIIDNTLNYNYYGRLDTGIKRHKRNYYQGKISEEFWDTLNNKLRNLNIKWIDTNERGPIIEDAHYFEFIINRGTDQERLFTIDTGGNYPLIKNLIWINNSYKNIKLHQIDKPLLFETTAQDPPHPNTISIKFPPPIKRKHITN